MDGPDLVSRLVDSGSGYDAQSVMPVHFGLATAARVDVEVVFPRGGRRQVTRTRNVDPKSWQGKSLVVRVEGR
jgi:hypothetical protein